MESNASDNAGQAKQNEAHHSPQKGHFKKRRDVKKFSGRKPVPEEVMTKYKSKDHEKYDGRPLPPHKKFNHKRFKLLQKEKKVEAGRQDAARAELLNTEQAGCLEAAEGFNTTSITQSEILRAADITTQTKSFELTLNDFGPYRFQYYRDGRHLALCGMMGHIASFNWLSKKLTMEINVMETAHDVTFMQDFNTMAVAQKRWTSIYDNKGIEIHSIKNFFEISRLDYMPYHFILAGLSDMGRLSYIDVSLGKEISSHKMSRNSYHLCHNPYNGVMATGLSSGLVKMWTPNNSLPVATVLCHKAPLVGLTFDPSGRYMVTADAQRFLRVWDARNLGEQLHSVRVAPQISAISVSQRGLLAIGAENHAMVYKGINGSALSPYMTHKTESPVKQLQFCPFEDVLGMSMTHGFSSIVIPGSGEPNFDAAEINPYSSKAGQREALVKGLLAKIPSELITLDPMTVSQVNVPSLEEKLEAHRKLKYVKVPKISVNPRYRMKGKSGSAQMARRKDIRKEALKKRYLDHVQRNRRQAGMDKEDDELPKDKHKEKFHENILDRFK